MDPVFIALLLLLVIFGIFAVIIYAIFSLVAKKKKLKNEIKGMFKARESGDDLIFKYRGYDVLVTFRPEVKVSILHDKDVEEVKSPSGAELTPMYLIFKVKKAEEIVAKLDRYIDFLDSIPTR